MQGSLCLAFTEWALSELINIHWPALANVPGGWQNKVAEVAHFTRAGEGEEMSDVEEAR